MSTSGLTTQVCDTPLLRADVTRLDSLGEAPPLEDEGPLSGCHLFAQHACNARQISQVSQRLRSRDADELHVAILNDLMSKVFPDVNVLCALPAASIHAVLFSRTGVGCVCAKPMRSRRLRR
jgi:hypothetical protein